MCIDAALEHMNCCNLFSSRDCSKNCHAYCTEGNRSHWVTVCTEPTNACRDTGMTHRMIMTSLLIVTFKNLPTVFWSNTVGSAYVWASHAIMLHLMQIKSLESRLPCGSCLACKRAGPKNLKIILNAFKVLYVPLLAHIVPLVSHDLIHSPTLAGRHRMLFGKQNVFQILDDR